MAVGRMEFHADSLMQHTNFAFVLPNDVEMEEVRDLRHYERPPKNLLLLHGLTGTDTDWLYGGIAQQLAIQYNLNVFMPTTGNSFYLDRGYMGGNHCTFIGQEFPAYLRQTFGLELKREDTLIGGLSMGGYGAVHVALAFPETFSACVALSSAIHTDEMATQIRAGVEDVLPLKMAEEIFGDPEQIVSSDINPKAQYRRLKEAGQDIPLLYLACGTEDDLCSANRAFAEFLAEEGADHRYEEGPGRHDWFFWNEYMDRGVNYVLSRGV